MPAVEVRGLKETVSALRGVSRDLPKVIQAVNSESARSVRDAARQAAAAQGSTAGHLSRQPGAFQTRATPTRATLQVDTTRYPYAAGAEFGARRYPQFKPWRGKGTGAGYFLFPTVRRMTPGIQESYSRVVNALIDQKIRTGGY